VRVCRSSFSADGTAHKPVFSEVFGTSLCRRLCHTAHASSHKNPTTSLRSFNVGDPKMNLHTDLFAGDWFLVPKWKAQAILSFNKIEMEREIHAVVCREKEREKEMACREK